MDLRKESMLFAKVLPDRREVIEIRRRVVGSNPTPPTTFIFRDYEFALPSIQ